MSDSSARAERLAKAGLCTGELLPPARGRGILLRMFDALDHVILGVRDLAAATRAYATLLGRRPSWRGEHPGEGTANTLFRLGNTYLELLAAAGDGSTGRALAARLDAAGDGPLGLALATADADAAHALLAERGLEPRPVQSGIGRDSDSGVFRRWRNVMLPPGRTRGVLCFAIEHQSPADLLPVAEPVGPEAAVVSGIDHAVIQTSDADAAIALYGAGLGLRLALDRRFPDWGMRLVFFRVGGVTLELAAELGGRLESRPTRSEPQASEGGPLPGLGGAKEAGDSDRLWGFSWRVPDADAARARLASAGLEVSEVRKGRKPGTRVLSVRTGTCGVPTLLIEPVSQS